MSKYAVVVLDATGSMSGEENRVVSSLNEYVETLPRDCDLTVFMFDSERWLNHYEGPVDHWKKMKDGDYIPGGMTPLYDAIGKSITHVRKKASRDDKVFLMIDTDGGENASSEYDYGKVTNLIKDCTDGGWAVHFMASGLTEAKASTIGVYSSLGPAGPAGDIGLSFTSNAYGDRLKNYKSVASAAVNYFNSDLPEGSDNKPDKANNE